ncbi:AraC family transcriptional regulator [Pontibacter cellulosilyticus]|uniref:AraC family transcriptional regulator N-terminal domain-containing protein n=1 Tax=Pontibacter cellulosilyticus TaxID=1720253 RepID=A0A923N723_9BACT|nr:AraC family transcriptional regulator N-terminal domain-containing protein [Pontibacter cellulosilyticus]MBC5991685.1 AraC family transcriptional regulator N-terminal domain-containing protein [Pontibacter cellulosilyticus]
MYSKYTLAPVPVHDEQSLYTLVENRSIYTMDNCELNVFETHKRAAEVELQFGDWVFTSMLRGKKVMQLKSVESFDYLPGESVIVPPNELMKIDFPEAAKDNPTQCIALAISADHIKATLDVLNERHRKIEDRAWELDKHYLHLENNPDLVEISNRLIRLGLKDHTPEKDIIANLTLRELLIRLMQTQARHIFERGCKKLASVNPFAHVMQHIKDNITTRIDVDSLSNRACMSRANFYRKFKEEFGYTPADFILKERIRLAKNYLKDPFNSVTQTCYMAGFQDLNYFIRAFKKEVGVTPKIYQVNYRN